MVEKQYTRIKERDYINDGMKQQFAYKFRIHPTENQNVSLSKALGCKRLTYNHLFCYNVNENTTKLKERSRLREVDLFAFLVNKVYHLGTREWTCHDFRYNKYDREKINTSGNAFQVGQNNKHGETTRSQVTGFD